MKVEGRWRRTIEVEGDRSVTVLDQARLPYEIAWMRLVELGEPYPLDLVRQPRLVEDDHRPLVIGELDRAPPPAANLHLR